MADGKSFEERAQDFNQRSVTHGQRVERFKQRSEADLNQAAQIPLIKDDFALAQEGEKLQRQFTQLIAEHQAIRVEEAELFNEYQDLMAEFAQQPERSRWQRLIEEARKLFKA